MAKKYESGMPQGLDLTQAWQIQFLAVSPVDGSAVSGVTVSNAGFVCTQILGTPPGLESGPFAVAPEWVPIPLDVLNSVAGG